jgi:uncharacterized protein HemY
MLLEAYRIRRAVGGPSHAWTADSHMALGDLYTRQGRYPEAEEHLLAAWAIVQPFQPAHVDREDARRRLRTLYERWGRPAEARRFAADATASQR